MTSRLTLTVLVDNTTFMDHDFYGEAGLSYLLETDGRKILFNTGLSGLFLANAKKMGIDLGGIWTSSSSRTAGGRRRDETYVVVSLNVPLKADDTHSPSRDPGNPYHLPARLLIYHGRKRSLPRCPGHPAPI
jgi:hypothetical protein